LKRNNKTTFGWFYFVGLPDKFDVRSSNRLQMPPNIHPIPLIATDLGAYATPKANTLMPLFN
jgi:hypothetical protein